MGPTSITEKKQETNAIKNEENHKDEARSSSWPTIGQVRSSSDDIMTKKREQQASTRLPITTSTNKDNTGKVPLASYLSDANSSTTVSTALENKPPFSQENQKPDINENIQQRLQEHLNHWEFIESTPVNYVFNFHGLFIDAERDFITTRVTFFSEGLSLKNRGALLITGIPKPSEKPSTLIISARDEQHGDNEEAWVHVNFDLPILGDAPITEKKHPLLDQIWYRLESSYFFLDEGFEYETVYCEAFKFSDNQAYYAKSTTKQTCPDAEKLQQIGTYHLEEKTLVVTSNRSVFDNNLIWDIKHSYLSTKGKGESHLTTVSSGKHVETYTLLKDKIAMESRLNITTGQEQYQMEKFEYLLPIRNNQGTPIQNKYTYLPVTAGIYIFDNRVIDSLYYQADSDLNINSQTHDMKCEDITYFYQSSTMGGQGGFSEIISTSIDIQNNHPIECEMRTDTSINKTFAYLDLDYDDYHEFVEGEVYSYILKPKPEYAHMVEELKLNLIYHDPNK
ncbi:MULTISPECIES: hypothetical protein [Aliivibrio]|uniref:Uncharacterized protein n=1 Tax=Aliivibrio finisterrensis TaxID=511998 RepID=A0A4Q5KWF5_9GAMM|nr:MULTISPECIES: hypothetical protein [Aliivibrio]MDD9179766.1 hypothetical protein [Aliivibrio sp. A6]RYU50438.1 hypothetical protein ERW57_12615 [Aliivibrio finisterrensis]RYU51182.1 hypothetical protein ERW56_13155 [Aliivibrio finisterrensis]RYU57004.1 hypothetical protein ERW50_13035 [Aliivibrio finisterrensis]RYU63576.1 hypothetical protein ERW53_13350 [Aliivibrio finisterrensis]